MKFTLIWPTGGSAGLVVEALASGTRCKEPLYSLSINPSAPISREQYYAAIDRIEQRLGLSGQARAVVFHVKHGREHAHVVWSRIDTAKMRAVQLSHDRQKLQWPILTEPKSTNGGYGAERSVTRRRPCRWSGCTRRDTGECGPRSFEPKRN